MVIVEAEAETEEVDSVCTENWQYPDQNVSFDRTFTAYSGTQTVSFEGIYVSDCAFDLEVFKVSDTGEAVPLVDQVFSLHQPLVTHLSQA